MPKLKLKADPQFTAKVEVPIAGGFADVMVTFKHMQKEPFNEWLKVLHTKKRVDAVLECATGWDLEEEFNPENVKELDSNYMGAANAIIEAYLREISGARTKN